MVAPNLTGTLDVLVRIAALAWAGDSYMYLFFVAEIWRILASLAILVRIFPVSADIIQTILPAICPLRDRFPGTAGKATAAYPR